MSWKTFSIQVQRSKVKKWMIFHFFQVHASRVIVEFYCGYQLIPVKFQNKQQSDIESIVCLYLNFVRSLLEEKVHFARVEFL